MIFSIKVGTQHFNPRNLPGEVLISDNFNRADSATTVGSANTGQAWIPSGGVWGITGNQIYCVSDVNADNVILNASTLNYQVESSITSYSSSRYLSVVFRYYDAANYLLARILNGNAEFYKINNGVATILASAPTPITTEPYNIKVKCFGVNVTILINNVVYINYDLIGSDSTKYPPFTRVGYRLSKSGTPTLISTGDDFVVKKL